MVRPSPQLFSRPHAAPFAGLVIGLATDAALAAGFLPFRTRLGGTSPALALLLPAVAAAIIGGRRAAVVTAAAGAGALSFLFIRPYDSYKIAVVNDAVALAVFVVVALAVGTLAARESDRRRAAEERAEEIRQLYSRYQTVLVERERFAAEATRVAVMERIDEQRSALLRSVSHDLRTPLATIRAVASDLRAGTDFDSSTRDDLLELVGEEAERLDRIVENLLSLSRIEAGAFQPDRQAVAIDELLVDRVARMSRLFDDVHVELDMESGLPFVDADYVQLDLVVTNLLENAARYAPPGSVVEMTAAKVDDAVRVQICDHGPGIEPIDVTHVFDSFHSGRDGGAGVGLAICKAVIEAHGGTIDVDSTIGKGSRFTFFVPVRHE